MNPSEREAFAADRPEQRRPGAGPAPASVGARQKGRDGMSLPLNRAMDALVKAQDYLNEAADQDGAELAKVIGTITENLKALQREVSNVIHNMNRE